MADHHLISAQSVEHIFTSLNASPVPIMSAMLEIELKAATVSLNQDYKLLRGQVIPLTLVEELYHLPTQLSHNYHQLSTSKNCQPHKTHL
jgi:hypothetical protein